MSILQIQHQLLFERNCSFLRRLRQISSTRLLAIHPYAKSFSKSFSIVSSIVRHENKEQRMKKDTSWVCKARWTSAHCITKGCIGPDRVGFHIHSAIIKIRRRFPFPLQEINARGFALAAGL